jgi:hypothetical protein
MDKRDWEHDGKMDKRDWEHEQEWIEEECPYEQHDHCEEDNCEWEVKPGCEAEVIDLAGNFDEEDWENHLEWAEREHLCELLEEGWQEEDYAKWEEGHASEPEGVDLASTIDEVSDQECPGDLAGDDQWVQAIGEVEEEPAEPASEAESTLSKSNMLKRLKKLEQDELTAKLLVEKFGLPYPGLDVPFDSLLLSGRGRTAKFVRRSDNGKILYVDDSIDEPGILVRLFAALLTGDDSQLGRYEQLPWSVRMFVYIGHPKFPRLESTLVV